MDAATLLFRRTPALRASPEFRFLADWVRAEARAVWPEIAERDWQDAKALGEVEADSPVLVAADDVLVLRQTLAALTRLVSAGTKVAVPYAMSEVSGLALEPIQTAGAFERLENQAIDFRRSELSATAGCAWPVSLWRAADLKRALAENGGWEENLARRRVPAAATAGLYHRFADYYGVPREDALPHVPPGTREVLEIGCGDGATGALLAARLGCRVTGVELNPVVAARAATRLHRVVVGDIQRLSLTGPFDLVMALELFEHLTEQAEFLARVRELLAPGGALLLSLPNVGHHAIVEELVAGRFDYIPMGLLCSTHHRFFTRRSLSDWFERAGFRDVQFAPQQEPLPERVRQWALASGLPHDLDSLATHGFFVLARP